MCVCEREREIEKNYFTETTHLFLVLQERDTVEEGERDKETRAKVKIIK